ncbi:hypothetical protein Tdes44962_MAKER02351 [Teratosphaeria destructans]|uniref:PH domain-containing protein n=1 Tax=Teratosphaeria destructans TaxID=418781 RepID=A0A9W7W386_9PEZI|nr:hypothetical protein Tdes44962_MAKER02351 [Teratosphaeria destructans]
MAAQVANFAAKKMLRKQMKNYEGKKVETGDDPYFALIDDPRRPGKLKKVKKQVPDYVPEHDAMILARVRKSAYRLDMCLFNLFGIRFGWEALIGLIPAAGDAIGVALAYMIFRECCKVDGGLPSGLRMRMIINIIIDFAVGLVPFLGDIADAAFKCNTKNLRLLEVHLDQKYNPRHSRGDDRDLAGVDRETRRKNRQSGIYHPSDPPPATEFEDFSDNEVPAHHDGARDRPAVQQTQRTGPPADRRGGAGSKGGWFGRGSKTNTPAQGQPMAETGTYASQETGSTRR